MNKIIIDCFGGDKSPNANVVGSVLALKANEDLEVILCGDEKLINEELSKLEYDKNRVSIINAPDVINSEMKPTDAIRLHKDSSMIRSIKELRENDDVCGLVSIGLTGPLVAASIIRIGRLKGVFRPAFCPVIPTMAGSVVGICDSGANVDTKADMLQQQAVMASIYMNKVYGVDNPRVALLNVGVEEEKGDDIHKEAYQLLKNTKCVNFVGNMESRDLLSGKYDLITCDGFSGNVLIKTTEGTALQILKRLKKDIYSKTLYKIGGLFMKKMFAEEKEFMNYHNYGGSVLLGLEKVVIKGHGSSDANAVKICIEQALKMKRCNINELIEKDLSSISDKVEE